ncbi:MAG TPA: 30S ribosomal protein S13 [Candidatus Nitrosotenuis sp.]|nr:30S ribosomal protein S13 [Candidatus Nitrosotenuis sp.]
MSVQDYRHIVRIVGKDIPGDKKLSVGLTHIKGVGHNFANALISRLGLNPNSNIGFLTETQVVEIEKALKDPAALNFPGWIFNRRKDVETGNTVHLITSDIAFTVRNDIEREKLSNSWRGFRHTYGLKVRGQRTRTTGRKGASVGVRKGGKVLPAGAVPAEGAAPAAPAAGAAPAAAPAAGAKPAAAKPAAPAAGAKPAGDAKAKK